MVKRGLECGREKGAGTKSAKHPKGRAGFWYLTPFPSPRRGNHLTR